MHTSFFTRPESYRRARRTWAVDKALAAAKDAEADGVFQALESARAILGEQLIEMGVRVPVTRPRKADGQAA